MKVSFKGWYKIPNVYVARKGIDKLHLHTIISPKMVKKGVIGIAIKDKSYFLCVRDDMEKIFENFYKRLKVIPQKMNKNYKI